MSAILSRPQCVNFPLPFGNNHRPVTRQKDMQLCYLRKKVRRRISKKPHYISVTHIWLAMIRWHWIDPAEYLLFWSPKFKDLMNVTAKILMSFSWPMLVLRPVMNRTGDKNVPHGEPGNGLVKGDRLPKTKWPPAWRAPFWPGKALGKMAGGSALCLICVTQEGTNVGYMY